MWMEVIAGEFGWLELELELDSLYRIMDDGRKGRSVEVAGMRGWHY